MQTAGQSRVHIIHSIKDYSGSPLLSRVFNHQWKIITTTIKCLGQALVVWIAAEEMSLVASGRYEPSSGATRNHETRKGKAVTRTATKSRDPSTVEWEALPTPANTNRERVSMADKTGRSSGEEGIPSSLLVACSRNFVEVCLGVVLWKQVCIGGEQSCEIFPCPTTLLVAYVKPGAKASTRNVD